MSRRTKKHPASGESSHRPPQDRGPTERHAAGQSPVVLAVSGLLVVAVFLVFGQTLGHDFVNYDDTVYMYQNPRVAHGFAPGWLAWAVTSNECNNWHPLTWFSHTLDAQLFGLSAGGHHATSVLLHAACAVLLFLVLRRMTGDLWCSAFVAAMFAVHPLRVESVAWIAERKDVLSGFFFMLTLGAYASYARRPFSLARYLTVIACFGLGLMAKPMLVTLPFVLLLLDYWPLGRMSAAQQTEDNQRAMPTIRRLVIEKIPLLILSGASCIVTVWAQGSAIQPLDRLPFGWRLANAVVSCVAYLWQMVHPVDLAVIYPHPMASLPWWQVAAALAVLAAITSGVVIFRRKCPYLLVGWFWYLGMLLPVIGLVQVGEQAMADRYTYLPQIGVGIAIAWGIAQLSQSWPNRRLACGLAAGLSLAMMMIVANRQTSYWRDSETLFIHTLNCTAPNSIAHCNLGIALFDKGAIDKAVEQYEAALTIKPKSALIRTNLGEALQRLGRYDESIAQCEEALKVDPTWADAHYNLAESLRLRGRPNDLDAAIAHFKESLRLKPNRADAHNNMGAAFGQQGKVGEAIVQFQNAIKVEPDCALAYQNLGVALLKQGKPVEAITQFRKALALAERQGNRALADAAKTKILSCEAGQKPR